MTPSPPAGLTFRPEAAGESAAVDHLVTEPFGKAKVGRLVASLRASDAWVDGLSFVAELDGTVRTEVVRQLVELSAHLHRVSSRVALRQRFRIRHRCLLLVACWHPHIRRHATFTT